MSRSSEPRSASLAVAGSVQPVKKWADEEWAPAKRVFVAGNIPASALREPEEVPVATAPDSECATAFRLLARQIEHLNNTRRMVVTSPDVGDGKSFAALNLGLALALGGASSVLLVEANFERPVLASRIGFVPPLCFAEWLKSSSQAPSRPFRSVGVCVPNFHVIAVDPTAEYTPGLVGVGFETAVRQLCFTNYQYIIVDGPAVMGSADCSIIADSMDGVVLCAAKASTKLGTYREAAKQLQPVPILAKVLLEK